MPTYKTVINNYYLLYYLLPELPSGSCSVLISTKVLIVYSIITDLTALPVMHQIIYISQISHILPHLPTFYHFRTPLNQ